MSGPHRDMSFNVSVVCLGHVAMCESHVMKSVVLPSSLVLSYRHIASVGDVITLLYFAEFCI